MEVPIACTLTADQTIDRLEEWRRLLQNSVVAVERVSDRRVRLRLDPTPQTLVEVVDLVQREKACCAFFDFSIDVEPACCWLVISVPAGATEILNNLVSKARH